MGLITLMKLDWTCHQQGRCCWAMSIEDSSEICDSPFFKLKKAIKKLLLLLMAILMAIMILKTPY